MKSLPMHVCRGCQRVYEFGPDDIRHVNFQHKEIICPCGETWRIQQRVWLDFAEEFTTKEQPKPKKPGKRSRTPLEWLALAEKANAAMEAAKYVKADAAKSLDISVPTLIRNPSPKRA